MLTILMASICLLVISYPDQITEASVLRILPGMSLPEVNEILGGPPTGGRVQSDFAIWAGSTGTAYVLFDGNGKAVRALFGPPTGGRLAWILQRLGLR
jgi:hypothetical protein